MSSDLGSEPGERAEEKADGRPGAAWARVPAGTSIDAGAWLRAGVGAGAGSGSAAEALVKL